MLLRIIDGIHQELSRFIGSLGSVLVIVLVPPLMWLALVWGAYGFAFGLAVFVTTLVLWLLTLVLISIMYY